MLDSELEKYTTKNPKEIAMILLDLQKHRNTIVLSFQGNNQKHQALTTVILVDSEKNTLYLDIGKDDNFNAELVKTNKLFLRIEHGIQIRWESLNPKIVTLKDGAAIKCTIPKELLRVQRREYCRFKVPGSKKISCHLVCADNSTIDLHVTDISFEGIGGFFDDLAYEYLILLSSDITFNCWVMLPDLGKATFGIQPKHTKEINLPNGIKRTQVGFKISEITRGNRSLIEKFAHLIERENIHNQTKQ